MLKDIIKSLRQTVRNLEEANERTKKRIELQKEQTRKIKIANKKLTATLVDMQKDLAEINKSNNRPPIVDKTLN